MENQMTAVEWLHEKFAKATKTELKDNVNLFFKEAKQMEMEQITDAWEDGKDSFSTRNAEIYYNETFKNK